MLSGYFIQSRFIRQVVFLSGLLIAISSGGCGKQKKPWDKAYPAKGSLTFQGKPVADAEIALFPEDTAFPETVRPKAKTNENGEFVVWTYQAGDGAPAGKYKATVVHHRVDVVNDVVVTRPNDLPPKYSRLQTTDLVVEVSQGTTELPPFELK